MKFTSPLVRGGLAVSAICLLILLAGWTDNPQQPDSPKQTPVSDTIPNKKENSKEFPEKDLDKALRELERAQEALNQVEAKDWEKIQRDIESSLKKIDFDKMQLEIEQSLKKIDFDKIQKEINESLKKIDFDKMERDIERSLEEAKKSLNEKELKEELQKVKEELKKAKEELKRELKDDKWRAEAQAEIEKIKSVEISKEMEAARKEVAKAKAEIETERVNIRKELEKARKEIDETKKELLGYQEMIYEMEKENLLSTKSDYTIKFDNEVLTVNGKKLSDEQTARYKKYLKKDKVTISKENGEVKVGLD